MGRQLYNIILSLGICKKQNIWSSERQLKGSSYATTDIRAIGNYKSSNHQNTTEGSSHATTETWVFGN